MRKKNKDNGAAELAGKGMKQGYQMPQAYCDVRTLGRYLSISPRRVQQLVKKGILPREIRGVYELIPCIHAYLNNLRRNIYRCGALHAREMRRSKGRTASNIAVNLKVAPARSGDQRDQQKPIFVADDRQLEFFDSRGTA